MLQGPDMPSILISCLSPGRGKFEIHRFQVILDSSEPDVTLIFLVDVSSWHVVFGLLW